jgi:hypothetical protein
VAELRSQVHENEKMSEQIKEAALKLRARAMAAEERCLCLEKELSNGNASSGVSTSTAPPIISHDTAHLLSTHVKSIREEYNAFRSNVHTITDSFMQHEFGSFGQQLLSFVQRREEMLNQNKDKNKDRNKNKNKNKDKDKNKKTRKTPSKLQKNRNTPSKLHKNKNTPSTPSRHEVLSCASPSSLRAISTIAQQAGNALLTKNNLDTSKLRQKLHDAKVTMQQLKETNLQSKKEHQDEIVPLKQLIRVLRLQIDEHKDAQTKIQLNRAATTTPTREVEWHHHRHQMDAAQVRAAYQEDLLAQSKEINDIIDTVRLMKSKSDSTTSRALTNSDKSTKSTKSTNSKGSGSTMAKQMVVWNGMLEQQNIALEKQLVAVQGELVASRQSLTRSNAETSRIKQLSEHKDVQLKKLEREMTRKKRRATSNLTKRGRRGGPAATLQKENIGAQWTAASVIADLEIRQSMAAQIQMLEQEKTALRRELESQGLVIHNLTHYQDGSGDEL